MVAKLLDITNQKFGLLTAIKATREKSGSAFIWEFKCDCGQICKVRATRVKRGEIQSCGCHKNGVLKQNRSIFPKQKFGMLTAICPSDTSTKRRPKWLFECDCSVIKDIRIGHVITGHTRSCGCLHNKNKDHFEIFGRSNLPEYKSWRAMLQRCYNINNDNYKYYGGRDIKVCDSWRKSFDLFMKDMGNKPSLNHTIDRIDNNKDYSLDNCRWANKEEQANNCRNNFKVEYQGKKYSLKELSNSYKISYHALYNRIFVRNWDIQKALMTPLNSKKSLNNVSIAKSF